MPSINTAFQVPLPYQTMRESGGEGVTGSFMQAYNNAKQQQDPLLALKKAALEQDLQMQAFSYSKALQDRQDVLNAEKAAREAAPAIQGMLGDPNKAYQTLLTETIKNPILEKSPTWQGLAKNVNTAGQLSNLLEDNQRQIQASQFSPAKLQTVTDPSTGRAIQMIETAPGKWQMVDDKEKLHLRTNPDGTTEIIMGGAPGDMERSTKAALEQKNASAMTSLSLLDESLGLISPSTVGPIGKANVALEKTANFLKPGSMKPTASNAQQTFRITAQQQYNSLKVDSQINKMEAAAMREIADVTDWLEVADTATGKYQILQDLTALQIAMRAKALGQAVPDAALKVMSIGQVSRAWKRGDISGDDVMRWDAMNGFVK